MQVQLLRVPRRHLCGPAQRAQSQAAAARCQQWRARQLLLWSLPVPVKGCRLRLCWSFAPAVVTCNCVQESMLQALVCGVIAAGTSMPHAGLGL